MAYSVTSITNSVSRVIDVAAIPQLPPHHLKLVTLHLVPHVTAQMLRPDFRGCLSLMEYFTELDPILKTYVPASYLQKPNLMRRILRNRFDLVIDDDGSVDALVSRLHECFCRTGSLHLRAEFEVSSTTLVESHEEELEMEWREALRTWKRTCGFDSRGRTELGTCSICLDDLCSQWKVIWAPCSHVYHESCIDSWLKRKKNSCPICRAEVLL